MAPSKTRTVKNKHAAPKKSATDGGSKPSGKARTGPPPSKQLKEKNRAALVKKPKKKVYTEAELGIPKLNMITPVGVVKPKGKKKGKVFVDDNVCSYGTISIMSIITFVLTQAIFLRRQ